MPVKKQDFDWGFLSFTTPSKEMLNSIRGKLVNNERKIKLWQYTSLINKCSMTNMSPTNITLYHKLCVD